MVADAPPTESNEPTLFFLSHATAAASAARSPPTVVAVPSMGKPPKAAELSFRTATAFVSMLTPTARTAFEKVVFVAERSALSAVFVRIE